MDYLTILKQQKLHKYALIINSQKYTYLDLINKIEHLRKQINKYERSHIFIYEDSILEQLCKFIAYSGTNIVPIIATKISKHQNFKINHISQNACMGVMTSGSTGQSKILWRNFSSWADFFPIQNNIFNINQDTIIFCQGSLAFTGNLNIYMSILFIGGTIVATEKFAPKTWLNLMKNNLVNAIYMIPSKLLLLPKYLKEPNTHITTIISGSQSMGKSQAQLLKKIYPQSQITLYYGASELNYISYIKDTEMTEDNTSIGKPFPNIKISIKNDEILVDTPYAIEDISLPYSLKDKGYIDDKNNLHFLGRSDDICNLNGLKISRYKIENLLKEKLHLEEVAVEIIHQNNIDILVAFVSNKKLPNKSEIISILHHDLSEYEIPKKFIKLTNLPKNESGKIDRFQLSKINIK